MMAASLHHGPDDGGDAGEGIYRPMAEINVTPFVDVMLVLLIIFMVAAPLMMVGVPLDLPKTDAARIGQTRDPVVVSVDQDRQTYIGTDPVMAGALVQRLVDLRQVDPDITIYIRAHKSIDYGEVMKLLGQVGQAGFAKISLVAESESGVDARPVAAGP